MKRITITGALCFCFFFLSLSPSLFPAQPTEKSLLEFWEALQKNDPKTLVFEKLGENRFKFKTDRFPFDGELIVLNVNIDDEENSYTPGFAVGVITVKLKDLSEDFMQDYSYSYSMWAGNNVLYFNKKTEKWMTGKEYFKKNRKKLGRDQENFFESFIWYLNYLILCLAVIFMIISWRKVVKRNEKNTERSFALSEETNRLLKEVLEELKKKSTP